jgi:hypothetical protein
MNVSVGLANGAWETATTLNPGLGGSASSDGDWSASYEAVAGKGGEVAVSCTYTKTEDWESRMVCMAEDGKLTVIPEISAHAAKLPTTSGLLMVSSNEFAHIKEFQLQRRNYQWVEFRNVALQPGLATTVTVKDFGGEKVSPPVAQKLSFDAFVERVRRELSRASVRFDKLHISAVNDDNFIVSFSGLEAHGVLNGKDAWLPMVGSAGELAAKRSYFGGNWEFKGLNQLGVARFTVANLDLDKLLETNLAEALPAAPALAFGPVTECILPMDKEGLTTLFDLDHDRPAFGPKPNDTAAGMAQLLKPGVVIRHDEPAHKIILLGMSGTVLYWASAALGDQWENLTDTNGFAAVRQNTTSPGVIQGIDCPDNLPQSAFFKTGAGKLGLLQIAGFTDNPRGVMLRYKLVQANFSAASQTPEPADLREAKAKLAELKIDFSPDSLAVQRQLARINELERLTREEPNAPADLRKAKVKLAELKIDYAPDNLNIQRLTVRIKELERLTREDPDAPADLREAKAHLAELRVDFAEQNPRIQEALAGIKALEQNTDTQSAAAPISSFGPVVKRTVYDYESGKDWLLNFKTGETFRPPASLNWEKNFSAIWEWAHAHGAHVTGFSAFSQHWHEGDPIPVIISLVHGYGSPTAAERGLFAFEMKAVIVPAAPGVSFETVTPAQLDGPLQNQPFPLKNNPSGGPTLPQFASMAWHGAKWQGTDDYLYAFQTEDGQSGLLQITGFTDNPRGVKLRYKLVQNVPDAAAQQQEQNMKRMNAMRQFLLGMVMFKDVHTNQWPDTLAQTFPYLKDISPEELAAKASAFRYQRPETNLDENAAAMTAVLFEKNPVRADGQYLGYADGHVEFARAGEKTSATLRGGTDQQVPTGDAPQIALPTKTIVLTRETNQLVGNTTDTRTVRVWSDSTLLPGEKLRLLTRLPDGETAGGDAGLYLLYRAGKAGTSTSFDWWFKEDDGFGAAEAEAATAQIRDHWTQTPLTFTSSAPREVFCVTNARGATLTGSIEFIHTAPQPPDASGPIKATVQVKHFCDIISFPGIGFTAKVPGGYALRATSNHGEGHLHSPAGPYDYDATWFPMNYGAQEPAATGLSWNLKHAPSEKFEVILGQPRLILSLTNTPDDVFEGFLELVGPDTADRK